MYSRNTICQPHCSLNTMQLCTLKRGLLSCLLPPKCMFNGALQWKTNDNYTQSKSYHVSSKEQSCSYLDPYLVFAFNIFLNVFRRTLHSTTILDISIFFFRPFKAKRDSKMESFLNVNKPTCFCWWRLIEQFWLNDCSINPSICPVLQILPYC